jgi:large subunit ribosomal protein L1
MKKVSKRIAKLNSLKTKEMYSFQEGVRVLKNFQSVKFEESFEAHIALNIDPKYANQQLRTSFVLPHGTGKKVRIAVFTPQENVKKVLDLGAFLAGSDDLLEEINSGNMNFDILLTTPDLMPKLARLGKILGPKGLMPSPKSGTVTQNLEESLKEFQKGKIEYRADKTGIVHLLFGKTNFSEEQLQENLLSVYESIEKSKPAGVKGKYFKSFYICTTMSPSIKIDFNTFK